MAWVSENLDLFWSAAQEAYEEVGRGAIVADTTVRPASKGHPFGYFSQELIVAFGDLDAVRMVAQYEPEWQLVVMLLKTNNRVSTYRIGMPDQEADHTHPRGT